VLLIVPPNSNVAPEHPKVPLIKALARAHGWYQKVIQGKACDIGSLAHDAGLTHRYIGKVFRCAFLAPDIVEAILAGRQPRDLNFEKLFQGIPLSWVEQREQLGFSLATTQQESLEANRRRHLLGWTVQDVAGVAGQFLAASAVPFLSLEKGSTVQGHQEGIAKIRHAIHFGSGTAELCGCRSFGFEEASAPIHFVFGVSASLLSFLPSGCAEPVSHRVSPPWIETIIGPKESV
jgi:hypothetical protein